MTHLLCFGDSITRGENDAKHGGWADRLKTYFIKDFLKEQHNEVCVFNLGIGGETTNGLKNRFKTEFDARRLTDQNDQTIVTIAYGINDLAISNANPAVSEEHFLLNMQECIKYALQKKAKVILINILPIVDAEPKKNPKFRKPEDIGKYNSIIEKLSADFNISYVNVFSPFNKSKAQFLTPDGIHPNSKGHKLLYKTIKKQVLKEIKF
ncbi:SGNH/GDSL hydrolase family protein [Mucilaginibacter sp. L196]|uniref:SGNH/GDSL hydrolase family protein n=1 Tax=Mucilaginibacter sp. L196 TaxID=1641870 RepID=UPI00131AFC39|nr:SGNH/GDSL hydrolase family protein [Mucilaginibacter sp. L196]